jgi:hypothetical protein
MFGSILDTRNYNECMKYVNDLEHFYIGAKLSQHRSERIKQALETFCKERNYNIDSIESNCSSVNVLGDNTLNKMIKSPVDPSLENPFPLIIFSSRF